MKTKIFSGFAIIFLLTSGNLCNAQRTWFGLGYGYKSLNAKGIEFTADNGNAYMGHTTGYLSYPGLYISHYSNVRRGYTFGVNPLTSYMICNTSNDGSQYTKIKGSGTSVSFGFFGLIASDYLSKLEVQVYNNFQVGFLKQNTYVMMDLIGLAARYRITRSIKLAVDATPLNYYYGSSGEHFGFNTTVRILYSPR